MQISPIRYLIFLSAVCLIFSCDPYRHMQKISSDPSCVYSLKPDFNHVMYKTSVDVVGKHLSGILLFKNLPDSSTRIVFLSETGFSFFDFGFGSDSGFRVYQITPQMNNKALIKILRKDFELLLFRNMNRLSSYALADSNRIYHAFPQEEETNYYITDTLCQKLFKMQRATPNKRVMEAVIKNDVKGNPPDSIFLIHYLKINFTISLKKITPLAAE
jgi:hypothetical protein